MAPCVFFFLTTVGAVGQAVRLVMWRGGYVCHVDCTFWEPHFGA